MCVCVCVCLIWGHNILPDTSHFHKQGMLLVIKSSDIAAAPIGVPWREFRMENKKDTGHR